MLSDIIRKTLYFTDHVHAICVPDVQSYRFPYLMRKATKVVGYMTPEGKRFHSWAANLHTGESRHRRSCWVFVRDRRRGAITLSGEANIVLDLE